MILENDPSKLEVEFLPKKIAKLKLKLKLKFWNYQVEVEVEVLEMTKLKLRFPPKWPMQMTQKNDQKNLEPGFLKKWK